MLVSSVFKELSAVLAEIESSGTDVQHAEVDKEFTGSADDVTAELAVEVPVLPDSGTSDRVSVVATDAEVVDGRVVVDLAVTVSEGVDEPTTGEHTELRRQGTGSAGRPTPAYKDPVALQAAYEQHDSFPEMTEALGVTVTPETVRRHMVKHGIHDPEGAKPASFGTVEAATGESDRPVSGGDDSTAQTGTADDSSTDTETEGPEAPSAVTDGGSSGVDGTVTDTESAWANRPVSEVLAAAVDRDETHATAGSGLELPPSLTVVSLAEAINQSRTVDEVTQHVDVNRSTARQLLDEFDLTHFVSHPLATNQMRISVDEVVRRIEAKAQ